MNSLGNLWMSFKNSLFKQSSPIVNTVSSVLHNHRMSCVRSKRKKLTELFPNQPKYWPGGQKYYGFIYYPRSQDQIEPEWERSPLFMVTRCKSVKGNPYWLKRILRDLRIEQNNGEVAIVINSEHMNQTLWKIKHLVKITPITFPDGIPEEKDIDACRLYPNGEFRFKSTLRIDPVKMNATEVFQQSIDRIDKQTVEAYSRKKWDLGYSTFKDY